MLLPQYAGKGRLGICDRARVLIKSRVMDVSGILNVFDSYERRARLYPALLATLPATFLAVSSYGVDLKSKGALIGLLVSFGALFLIASIVRDYGKRLEEGFYPDSVDGLVKAANSRSRRATLRRIRGLWNLSR